MKAILFDLDETLLDRTSSLIQFCEWQARERLTLKDAERYVARFLELDANGSSWKDRVYEVLKSEFAIPSSVDELLGEYVLRFPEFCRERPGALESVRLVASKGFRLGLVSNGKSPFQESSFSALGVDHLFSAIVVSGAVGCSKPDPRIFEIACNTLEVAPDQCIFVGDNPTADIQGAGALGMYTIFVPGRYYGSSCPHANAVCSDFRDLAAIIENVS